MSTDFQNPRASARGAVKSQETPSPDGKNTYAQNKPQQEKRPRRALRLSTTPSARAATRAAAPPQPMSPSSQVKHALPQESGAPPP